MAVDDPAQGQGQVLDCWGEHDSSRICRNVELNGRTQHKVLSTYRSLQGWLGHAGLCQFRWWPRRRKCLKKSYYIWINNYHYQYVPASSDLIGEMMRAPSGWMVTRPWKGKWRSKWSDCWYELSIIWASNIVVMILILVVLFGCIRGSAVFMHDFNLETKHSLKMKTDQGPRSKYCDCHLVSQDQSFCIWVHY